MIKPAHFIATLLIVPVWAGAAMAVTATLTGDAFTVSGSATANKGAKTALEISGPPDSDDVETGYVKFDISTLPGSVTAAEISKATLTLFVNKVSAEGSFDVQRVTGAWTEATITAGTAPTLGTVEQSAVAVTAADKNQYKVVDVTNVVKAWRDGSLTNNGLALVANAVDGLEAKFDSKESKATSQVPRLEITLSSTAGSGTVANVSAASPLSVTDPTTTPNITLGTVPINLGGTNATTASTARTNLAAAASGANSDITSLSGLTTPLSLGQGGTDATNAAAARSNLGAAASGTNSDITSLSGLTTPLSLAQGGTNATTPGGARSQLGAAASGNNFDITSLGGITGNISLPISTSSSTGNILKAGFPFLHDFGGTFVGFNAGNFSQTGFANTGLGGDSLSSTTSGIRNTGVGSQALQENTSGSENTAVGSAALINDTTGDANTAVGSAALLLLATGDENTAVGAGALALTTAGNQNSAFGNNALRNNTASHNTAVGYLAQGNNTTGSTNTAIGYIALSGNSTGSNNIAVGSNAGMLTTGSNNIAIGHPGAAAEANTIRVGDFHTRAFISGIRGVTTGVADAVPVLIDSNGQLGTLPSVPSPLTCGGFAGTVTTAATYVFLGSPTSTVALVAGQKVTGVVSAAIGKSAAGLQAVRIDLCSQESSNPIMPLLGSSNYLVVELDNGPRQAATVSNHRVVTVAGNYKFGFCAASNTTPVTLDRNDWVNGWVMITN